MNVFEKELKEVLVDLKENHYATALKAEFETETATYNEVLVLKNMVKSVGLDFIVKIGGCGAVKDLHDAKALGADVVVAPMVESSYALEKFVSAFNSVFTTGKCSNKKLFINIETKQGYNNLYEIFNSEYISLIDGVVVGRSDLAASLGLYADEVNDEKISEYTKTLLSYAAKYNKEFIVGGNISGASVPFLKKIFKDGLTKFETRKIVFDRRVLEDEENAKNGILKAIKFELLWLENISNPDIKRLNILKERYSFKY